MAVTTFDIRGLFRIAFGFGMEYRVPEIPQKKQQTALGSPLWGKNSLGITYFMPVELDGIELPNTLINISGKKNIVETSLVGQRGTVKELINIEDYEIMIRGIVVDDQNSFPDEFIMKLQELYEKNESVALKCALTDIFLQEDDSVVIRSIRFPEMRGVEHAQAFEIECMSDPVFDLTIE